LMVLQAKKMEEIRKDHKDIMRCIEKIHLQTANKIKEKEKDLLRTFRIRLFEVQKELEAEKRKSNDESTKMWIKKHHKLESRVDRMKKTADKLEQANKHYQAENQRLTINNTSQEDDRALLVKQLVMAKRDNARYKDDLAELKESISNEESEKQKKNHTHQINKQQSNNSDATNDERYKEVIFRLKHLLKVERKSQAKLRETYHKSLEGRSELENYLRQCIQDTKIEIARRQRNQSGHPVSVCAGEQPLWSKLMIQDR